MPFLDYLKANFNMDINNICRFCMTVDESMYNIFEDLALKVKADALLSNLKILFDDSLPNYICKHCIYQLNEAYKFKIKCEHSDFLLRKHINEMQSSKISEIKKEDCIDHHEEIQIDSSDEDDVGSIAEPLVVLSSSASLEETNDPLNLGYEDKSKRCRTDSCKNTKSVTENIGETKPAKSVVSNYVQIPKSEQEDDVKEQISETSSELKQMLPISEHFMNESCDTTHFLTEGSDTFINDSLQCPVCGLVCASKNRLSIHLSEHEGETPYICPVCNKGFGRGGGLKAHLKLHSGEKPYICKVCNKAFSLKGNLKVHSRLHTGERPFQCQTCMKAFTQKISLTKHLSVHKQRVKPNVIHDIYQFSSHNQMQ